MSKIFTFWEGEMPAYIDLCLSTWQFDFIELNYDNLDIYTDLDISKLHRFTLPQIADIVRVHVLRDNGGYWLDADTIMLKDELPSETIMGYPDSRTNTIGFLHTEKNSDMFKDWADFQDLVIADETLTNTWDMVGNAFTDGYLKKHKEILIGDISNCWAETYMINEFQSRYDKYRHLYFNTNYELSDFKDTNMLMLHNSWTPNWYKKLNTLEVLSTDCTLSNILKEALK